MEMNAQDKANPGSYDIVSWLIMGVLLLLTLELHLLPALLAGLLVYELVHLLAPLLRITRLAGNRAKVVVVMVLSITVVVLLALLTGETVSLLRSESGSIPEAMKKMAEILEGSRDRLPAWLVDYLPADAEGFKNWAVHWLRTHAGELQAAGKEVGRVVVHIVIGMVIGVLISLREVMPIQEYRPLGRALVERVTRFSEAFSSIIFAQVRIAALNTFFAWLYLGVVLPVLGIHLPLVKTMVAITFLSGLLPVAGNLISNSVIVVVSLSQSLSVVAASFVFLVVIHKLEYFLNATIVGSRIHARAWELLVAMLVMEAAFGLAGLIAAPIYYAYVKNELADWGLV
jgi:predicted PurR-regulated permease PerM